MIELSNFNKIDNYRKYLKVSKVAKENSKDTFLIDTRPAKNKQFVGNSRYWKTESHTWDTFYQRLADGYQYTSAHYKRFPSEIDGINRVVKSPNIPENFVSSRLLTFDDDSLIDGTIDFWTRGEFSKYVYAFVESKSSKPGKEKGHILVMLDNNITCPDTYKFIHNAFTFQFQQDRPGKPRTNVYQRLEPSKGSCNNVWSNPARKGKNIHHVGNVVSFDLLNSEFGSVYQSHLDAIESEKLRRVESLKLAQNAGISNNKGNLYKYQVAAKEKMYTRCEVLKDGRYTALRALCMNVASFALAEWTDNNLWLNAESEIIATAYKNGYLSKDGTNENSIRLLYQSALCKATPINEPAPIIRPTPTTTKNTQLLPKTNYNQSHEIIPARGGNVIHGLNDDIELCAVSEYKSPHYNGFHDGQPMTIRVKDGQYLSNCLSWDDMPKLSIVNCQTGLGKTTFASECRNKTIYVCSSLMSLEQYKKSIQSKGFTIDVYCGSEKTVNEDSSRIVTTYESLANVISIINTHEFTVIIDEAHNIASSASAGYRKKSMRMLLSIIKKNWHSVVLLSGTHYLILDEYLKGFKLINVESINRAQLCKRVTWDKRMTKYDAFLNVVDTNKSAIIYLNDKKGGLDKLMAGLSEISGISQVSMGVINSDKKSTQEYRELIEFSTLKNKQFVFVTSLFKESINLMTHFENVYIYDSVSPIECQQLINRLRGDAMADCVYWFNNNDGEFEDFNALKQGDYILSFVKSFHEKKAKLSEYSPFSAEHHYLENELSLYGGNISGCTYYDRQIFDMPLCIDYASVSNMVYKSECSFSHKNPNYFKSKTSLYGCVWGNDIKVGKDTVNPQTKDIINHMANSSKEIREKVISDEIKAIKENGYTHCKLMVENSELTGISHRLSVYILKVNDELSRLGIIEPFDKACDMVADCGDSKAKVNATIKRVKVQWLRHYESCDMVNGIYSVFAVGEIWKSEDIFNVINKLYDSHVLLSEVSKPRKELYNSIEEERRLTKTKATQILKLHFGLSDRNGKHGYRILNDDPLLTRELIEVIDVDTGIINDVKTEVYSV